MLKPLSLLAALILPAATLADEQATPASPGTPSAYDYSGVWVSSGQSYMTIHIKGDTAVAAELSKYDWLAYMGYSTGHSITISNLDDSDGLDVQMTITWTDQNSANLRIDRCRDGFFRTCGYTDGTQYPITRLF